MRISTSQIYDAGSLNIQRNQGEIFKTQNQLSTGRRFLTPADDPVAAAQALVVAQSQAVTEQHVANQGNANSQLGLVDNQLSSLTDLLQNVRERVVQAGNTTLSASDRQSIATELEARLSEMLGIANSDNGSGDFLFSGYQGATRPFAVSGAAAIAPASTSPIDYFGDDGERLLQVSSARQMAVSVAGSEVFMNARNGNGAFVTGTGGQLALPPLLPPTFPAAVNNQGTATVDAGSVVDPGQWNAAGNPGNFLVQFSVTTSATGVKSTTYQLYDNSGAVPAALLAVPLPSFTPGQSIALEKTTAPSDSYGASIVVQGQPEDGDSFTIAPSTNQSVFQTVQNLIGILRSNVGSTSYTSTQFTNELGGQLTNVDQALNNVSQVQATVGTRMRELESLGIASSDLEIQFSETLSDLQDLDYAKAISDYTRQQVQLEAAQKSFVQISGLSLFNFI